MRTSEPPSFHVRLPGELQKRLKIAAAENDRSMNAEIVARLQRSFDLADDERSQAISLLGEALSILNGGR